MADKEDLKKLDDKELDQVSGGSINRDVGLNGACHADLAKNIPRGAAFGSNTVDMDNAAPGINVPLRSNR